MIPKRLLPHTVTYEPFEESGGRGPTYGEPVTVRARVQFQGKLVRDSDSNDIMSSATVYFQPDDAPALGDRLTLPDGQPWIVIKRDENTGARTVEMVTVYVG